MAPAATLCLDYANTRYWRGSAAPTESLGDFEALLRWLEQARVVDADTASCLRALRQGDPDAAQRLFDEARHARELLYGLFDAASAGVAWGALADPLCTLLAAAPPRHDLVLSGGQAGWRVPMLTPSVGELLAPVLWSAADLLLALDRMRLRRCANAQCAWLFLDDSKGGTRRWCSMSACGNRAKVRRHFLRNLRKVR